MRADIRPGRAVSIAVMALVTICISTTAFAQASSDTIGGTGSATGPGPDDRIHPRNPDPAVNAADDKARETVLEQNRGVNTNTDSGRPSSGAKERAADGHEGHNH